MAVISGGILKCRPFSEEKALCGGPNFLSHKVGGKISIRLCSSSNNNDRSVHSDNQNVGGKRTRTKVVILPCDVDKRRSMRWWFPLFGCSQADQKQWADDNNQSEIRAMDKSSSDHENEMQEAEVPKRSKFMRGRLTPEKAKILRKNLRDTSTFHDIMYHSATASRLASAENHCQVQK